jgi:hypothetical protein
LLCRWEEVPVLLLKFLNGWRCYFLLLNLSFSLNFLNFLHSVLISLLLNGNWRHLVALKKTFRKAKSDRSLLSDDKAPTVLVLTLLSGDRSLAAQEKENLHHCYCLETRGGREPISIF